MAEYCVNDGSLDMGRTVGIFKEYGDFIRKIINCHTNDPWQADDLFQDLFLSMATKTIPEEMTHARSYIYKVVMNHITDFARRAKRHQGYIKKYREYIASSPLPPQESPDKPLMVAEEANKMFSLIRKNLVSHQASTLMSKYKYHHDDQKTADKMGVKKHSVGGYISNTLKKRINELLVEKEGDDYGDS